MSDRVTQDSQQAKIGEWVAATGLLVALAAVPMFGLNRDHSESRARTRSKIDVALLKRLERADKDIYQALGEPPPSGPRVWVLGVRDFEMTNLGLASGRGPARAPEQRARWVFRRTNLSDVLLVLDRPPPRDTVRAGVQRLAISWSVSGSSTIGIAIASPEMPGAASWSDRVEGFLQHRDGLRHKSISLTPNKQ